MGGAEMTVFLGDEFCSALWGTNTRPCQRGCPSFSRGLYGNGLPP